MDILPILSTLRRHRIAAGLIVLEVALTCAIVGNALHLISTRLEHLAQRTGLAEDELLVLELRASVATDDAHATDLTRQDLARLGALPGVKSVELVNQVPFGDNSNNSGVKLSPDERDPRTAASQYLGGDRTVATLGLQLVEGRDFRPDEVVGLEAFSGQADPKIGQVIVNRELAGRLFPGRSALGQSIYVFGRSPSVIVGVVDTLSHPYLHRARGSGTGASMIFPVRGTFRGGTYLLRVDPARREALLKQATAAVEAVDPTRIVVRAKTLEEMRRAFFAADRSMAWLMGGVCVAMLLVTAMGIVGLASFWVQQRTRMIGTRRALGATRGQILRYFQAENFLLSSAGIAVGLVLAVALNLLLMQQYELPRLPWGYLPAAALALWGLGQLAVLAPARRAAALPPVAALRS